MISEHVVIRNATAADVGAIRLVAHDGWYATYSDAIQSIDIEQFLDRAYSREILEATIHRLGDGFIVAEQTSGIVGYAMAGLSRDGVAELFALYVVASQHCSGVGFALWTSAMSSLARRGYQRMCCWVLSSNIHARRFYERQGAIMTDERDFVVGASKIREARYCVGIGE